MSTGYYQYPCKNFYTHNCNNKVWIHGTACAECVVRRSQPKLIKAEGTRMFHSQWEDADNLSVNMCRQPVLKLLNVICSHPMWRNAPAGHAAARPFMNPANTSTTKTIFEGGIFLNFDALRNHFNTSDLRFVYSSSPSCT